MSLSLLSSEYGETDSSDGGEDEAKNPEVSAVAVSGSVETVYPSKDRREYACSVDSGNGVYDEGSSEKQQARDSSMQGEMRNSLSDEISESTTEGMIHKPLSVQGDGDESYVQTVNSSTQSETSGLIEAEVHIKESTEDGYIPVPLDNTIQQHSGQNVLQHQSKEVLSSSLFSVDSCTQPCNKNAEALSITGSCSKEHLDGSETSNIPGGKANVSMTDLEGSNSLSPKVHIQLSCEISSPQPSKEGLFDEQQHVTISTAPDSSSSAGYELVDNKQSEPALTCKATTHGAFAVDSQEKSVGTVSAGFGMRRHAQLNPSRDFPRRPFSDGQKAPQEAVASEYCDKGDSDGQQECSGEANFHGKPGESQINFKQPLLESQSALPQAQHGTQMHSQSPVEEPTVIRPLQSNCNDSQIHGFKKSVHQQGDQQQQPPKQEDLEQGKDQNQDTQSRRDQNKYSQPLSNMLQDDFQQSNLNSQQLASEQQQYYEAQGDDNQYNHQQGNLQQQQSSGQAHIGLQQSKQTAGYPNKEDQQYGDQQQYSQDHGNQQQYYSEHSGEQYYQDQSDEAGQYYQDQSNQQHYYQDQGGQQQYYGQDEGQQQYYQEHEGEQYYQEQGNKQQYQYEGDQQQYYQQQGSSQQSNQQQYEYGDEQQYYQQHEGQHYYQQDCGNQQHYHQGEYGDEPQHHQQQGHCQQQGDQQQYQYEGDQQQYSQDQGDQQWYQYEGDQQQYCQEHESQQQYQKQSDQQQYSHEQAGHHDRQGFKPQYTQPHADGQQREEQEQHYSHQRSGYNHLKVEAPSNHYSHHQQQSQQHNDREQFSDPKYVEPNSVNLPREQHGYNSQHEYSDHRSNLRGRQWSFHGPHSEQAAYFEDRRRDMTFSPGSGERHHYDSRQHTHWNDHDRRWNFRRDPPYKQEHSENQSQTIPPRNYSQRRSIPQYSASPTSQDSPGSAEGSTAHLSPRVFPSPSYSNSPSHVHSPKYGSSPSSEASREVPLQTSQARQDVQHQAAQSSPLAPKTKPRLDREEEPLLESKRVYDPRESASNSCIDGEKNHYTKRDKYSAFGNSLVLKRTPMLKRSSPKKVREKPRGLRLVDPHHARVEPIKGDKSSLRGETTSMKSPLSTFRIPKKTTPLAANVATASEKKEGKSVSKLEDTQKKNSPVKAKPLSFSLSGTTSSSTTVLSPSKGKVPTDLNSSITNSGRKSQSISIQNKQTAAKTASLAQTSKKVKSVIATPAVQALGCKPASAQPSAAASKEASPPIRHSRVRAVSPSGKLLNMKEPEVRVRKVSLPAGPPAPEKKLEEKKVDLTTVLSVLDASTLKALASTIQHTLSVASARVDHSKTNTSDSTINVLPIQPKPVDASPKPASLSSTSTHDDISQHVKRASGLETPAVPTPSSSTEDIIIERQPIQDAGEKKPRKIEASPIYFDPNYMQKEYNLRQPCASSAGEQPLTETKLDSVLENEPSQSKITKQIKRPKPAVDEQAKPLAKRFRPSEDSKSPSPSKQSPDNTAKDIPMVSRNEAVLQANKAECATATRMSELHVGERSPTARSKKSKSRGSPRKKSLQLKRKKLGFTSSISNMSTDSTGTVCSLCDNIANVSDLGFLYGPYKLLSTKEATPIAMNSGGMISNSGVASYDEPTTSVWIHEDCAVWAPGVCLVNGQIRGLKESIEDGHKMLCSMCGRCGATLHCTAHGCKSAYHLYCAKASGCLLKEEHFLTYCPKHKDANN